MERIQNFQLMPQLSKTTTQPTTKMQMKKSKIKKWLTQITMRPSSTNNRKIKTMENQNMPMLTKMIKMRTVKIKMTKKSSSTRLRKKKERKQSKKIRMKRCYKMITNLTSLPKQINDLTKKMMLNLIKKKTKQNTKKKTIKATKSTSTKMNKKNRTSRMFNKNNLKRPRIKLNNFQVLRALLLNLTI